MKPKLNCVLVIDDDEPTTFFNQMIVEQSGCTNHIKVAQSGQEALDYLTNSEHPVPGGNQFPCPDLIFLDINMPAMNGWEFLERYRKLNKEHQGNVIVVMLTTSLFPEDVARAKNTPEIAGFESKPLTKEKLNMILEKHFSNCTDSNNQV
jgi:CheY-like chemotaxis protein